MAALLLHKFVGAPKAASRGGAEQLTDRELHVLQDRDRIKAELQND
jgi:hypothetical protein